LVITRASIHWVEYRRAVGAEIRKRRPAVVVSNDAHNALMGTVTVVPFSSLPSPPLAPHDVPIPEGVVGDGRPCLAKPHQARAIDKSLVGRKIGELAPPVMAALELGLRLHLGLGPMRPPLVHGR
jgi:mRNA interferase MazF